MTIKDFMDQQVIEPVRTCGRSEYIDYITYDTLMTKSIHNKMDCCGPTHFPKPRKVIYDEDAGVTVVLWDDGQKTIVRAAADEQMDVYDAFCAAYCKRIYGSNSALKRELNKILTVKKKPDVKIELPSSELGAAVKKFGEDLAKALNTRNK